MDSVRCGWAGHRIGIVAGSGPDAGIHLWKRLVESSRDHCGDAFRGDLDAPHVTVFSNPALGLSMNLEKHADDLWCELSGTLHGIAILVDYVCIACYTLHFFEERIRALGLPAEFVSLVDVVVEHLCSRGIARVGLLTAGAIVASPSPLFAALSRHCEVETAADPAGVRQLVFDIKAGEPRDPELISKLNQFINDMAADTVVLGCTELSLVPAEVKGKALVDGVRLLAGELVRRTKGARQESLLDGETPN